MASVTKAITKEKAYLFFYLTLGVLWILLASGIIWGWSSMLIVLENEHIYYDLCSDQNIEPDPSLNDPVAKDTPCDDQITRLNLIYTVGVVTSSMVSLPAGIFLDRFGPAKLLTIGSILFGLGCNLFGLSAMYGFDGYVPAFVLLGIGGPSIFFSMLTTSNFFPDRISTALSFLNCAFDASVFVFFIFKLIYENTSTNIGTIFLAYSALSVLFLISAFGWPKPKIEFTKLDDTNVTEQEEEKTISLSDLPILQQAKSKEFLFEIIYLSVNQLWLNTYIGTAKDQFSAYYNESDTLYIMEIFSLILPFGFLASPFIGYFLDKRGILFSFSWLTISLTLFAFINLFKQIFALQMINFVIFTFCRAFFYAAVIAYVIKTFGFKTFGRLFGMSQVIAGASGMLQYALLQITFSYFDGNFLFMNALHLVMVAMTSYFPVFMWLRSKRTTAPVTETELTTQ